MRRKNWLHSATRSRIIVHTRDDKTFDGFLEAEHTDGLTLRSAALVEGPERSVPLAGEVRVHAANVSFVQFPDEKL